MVSNEKKQDIENHEEIDLSTTILGCIIGFLVIVVNSFWSFGQKIVCKKINEHVLNFYLGLYNALPALALMILENQTNLKMPELQMDLFFILRIIVMLKHWNI